MTLSDLQPFCGTDPTRFVLHQPFAHFGRTYATDGRIIVSTTFITGTATHPNQPKNPDEVIPANLHGYIHAELPPGWQDIPEIRKPCHRCGSTGKIYYTMQQCPDCDGDGIEECDHCHHESDCETCKGEGEVRIPASVGLRCPDCGGKGYDTETTWVSLNRGLCFVQLHYLKLAHTLPNLSIRVRDYAACLRLDFDGGTGALMPGCPGDSESKQITATQWP